MHIIFSRYLVQTRLSSYHGKDEVVWWQNLSLVTLCSLVIVNILLATDNQALWEDHMTMTNAAIKYNNLWQYFWDNTIKQGLERPQHRNTVNVIYGQNWPWIWTHAHWVPVLLIPVLCQLGHQPEPVCCWWTFYIVTPLWHKIQDR